MISTLIFILTGCSKGAFETTPVTTTPMVENNYKTNTLKVGVLGNTKPYAYYEDGNLTGFGIDYATDAFERINVNIEFVDVPFSRMLEELKNGTLDIAMDLYVKPEREEYAIFPDFPYVAYPTVLFKKSDMNFRFTGDLDELQPYTIGYVRGYSLGPLDKLKNNHNYEFSISDSPKTNIESLVNNRVNLIVDIKSTGEYFIKELDLDDSIEITGPPLYYDYAYIAFSKKNGYNDLVEEYNNVVMSMYEDGTISALSNKYSLELLKLNSWK